MCVEAIYSVLFFGSVSPYTSLRLPIQLDLVLVLSVPGHLSDPHVEENGLGTNSRLVPGFFFSLKLNHGE